MLELSKNILEKVSFDKVLFKKELKKAVNWLSKDELMLLKVWCITQFGHVYQSLIIETFKNLA